MNNYLGCSVFWNSLFIYDPQCAVLNRVCALSQRGRHVQFILLNEYHPKQEEKVNDKAEFLRIDLRVFYSFRIANTVNLWYNIIACSDLGSR